MLFQKGDRSNVSTTYLQTHGQLPPLESRQWVAAEPLGMAPRSESHWQIDKTKKRFESKLRGNYYNNNNNTFQKIETKDK